MEEVVNEVVVNSYDCEGLVITADGGNDDKGDDGDDGGGDDDGGGGGEEVSISIRVYGKAINSGPQKCNLKEASPAAVTDFHSVSFELSQFRQQIRTQHDEHIILQIRPSCRLPFGICWSTINLHDKSDFRE